MIRSILVLMLILILGCARDPGAALKVKEGDLAPDVDLPATGLKDAQTLHLHDFENKKNVVLFFFPRAMTSGCTVEACGFRDRADQFDKLDTVIVGISTDKLDAQQQFVEKEKLTFSLYADADQKVTSAFGALGPGDMANRVTFVIDKKGVVRKVYPTVN
ncbi:MAG: peroxiredoxin, partial [Gemmataceae bacterium]